MQPVVNYLTYSRTLTYEPQSMYLECGQGNRICAELKSLGTKRVLVLSRAEYLKSKNVEELINKLEESDKNKKNKSQKICNIISTNIMSPITNMKLDESETWLICSNNLYSLSALCIACSTKNWILESIVK